MNDKDYIKDLFADKLGKHEVKVNPELWNGIASKLGSAGAVSSGVATGMSVLTKGVIALIVGTAAVLGVVIVLNQEEPTIKKKHNTQVVPSVVEKKIENVVQEKETAAKKILNSEPVKQEVPDFKEVAEHSVIDQDDLVIQPKKEVFAEEKTEGLPQLEKDKLSKEDDPLKEMNPVIDEKTYITEQEEVFVQKEIAEITLPNIFSPNGDGQNDYLAISHDKLVLSDFSVVIMNQQSQMVFQSADPDFRWDGIDRNGMPVPAGKYLYYVTARDENGKPINKYNNLVIIR